MAQTPIPVFSTVLKADPASSANTLVQRDASNGITGGVVTGTGLTTTGNLTLATSTKTANYTAGTAETVILCDATSSAFAVTLPAAAACAGRTFTVKKIDSAAHNVTITPAGSETIDGGATKVLSSQWAVVQLISDGTNWYLTSTT